MTYKNMDMAVQEIEQLRRLLWLRHGCGVVPLYGDDGEMSCGACVVDFKRWTADHIGTAFQRQGEIVQAVERKHDKVEAVAEECHRQWSGWTEYLLSKLCHGPEGYSLDDVWIERWRRQIATPYADLSEEEKESDRREARKILGVLG